MTAAPAPASTNATPTPISIATRDASRATTQSRAVRRSVSSATPPSVPSVRAVVQRVSRARVVVDGETVGQISSGLLVLVGIATGDGDAEAERLAGKVARLRIF